MQAISVGFPGGLKVDARIGEFTIATDQSERAGGGGTAPAPFDYFLASIATCAGYYVLRFLTERKLSTDDVRLTLTADKAPEGGRLASVRIDVEVPAGFPTKYVKALARAVDQCTVKRSILQPPSFETEVRVAPTRTAATRDLALV